MDFLETLFWDLREKRLPLTQELVENERVTSSLMEQVKETMGVAMADKVDGIYGEHEDIACDYFFRYGVQLGLELLGLLV